MGAVCRWFVVACCALMLAASARAEYLAVHVGYVVPTDRSMQSGAAANLWEAAQLAQVWYAEQMDRWGFGPLTFKLDSYGATHVVHSTMSAAAIRSDIWPGNIDAATGAGLPIWSTGQVWFLASNSHQMQPDGSVQGGTALGASFGSADDAGVAMLGGDAVPFLGLAAMRNQAPYAGQTIPEVGPYPLVQDVSRPWFEGTTISSVASSLAGAMAHELGHAFGLPHIFLNDNNFDGVLMGNGLRGFRGVFAPDLFTTDDTWLSYASALALSTSRYFNSDAVFTEMVKPTLSVSTSGNVDTVDGHLQINFTASDASGLSAAILMRNGDVVAAMPLEGTSAATSIDTSYFQAGVQADFQLRVYDTQGNLQLQNVAITPQAVGNLAPQPIVRMTQSIIRQHESITFNVGDTVDPDHSGQLWVEWDLDGDGIFDTEPSSTLSLTTSFDTPGGRSVIARVIDGAGASALSMPVPIRVLGVPGDYDSDGQVTAADYDTWRTAYGRFSVPWFGEDGSGDARVNAADYVVWRNAANGNGSLGFATVPEPPAILLIVAVALAALMWRS